MNQLGGAAFGAAGQRCMALSTAIFVGEAQKWIPDLIERTQKLVVNAGMSHVIRKIVFSTCFLYKHILFFNIVIIIPK